MTKDIPKAAGITWYKSKEDYQKALSTFEDAFKLPTTYEAFLKQYEVGVAIAKQRGFIPVKAELDPATFPDWCAARSLHVDAHGREAFANEVAVAFLRDKGFLRSHWAPIKKR